MRRLIIELLAQVRFGFGPLGNNQKAARVLVYTVYESQTRIHGVVFRILSEVVGQCIDQCTRVIAMAGVYH